MAVSSRSVEVEKYEEDEDESDVELDARDNDFEAAVDGRAWLTALGIRSVPGGWDKVFFILFRGLLRDEYFSVL